MDNERKIIRISKRLITWCVIIIVILFLLILLLSRIAGTRGVGSGPEAFNSNAIPTVSYDEGGMMQKTVDSMMLPSRYYDGGQPGISDTREFLKTNYEATIKTRNVSKIVRYVKNAVAGADGRIDSASSSEKYGRISFVVAKSKFDSFRDEIESLTHAKLYTENISSENLLSQKQDIEEQTNNITNNLDSLSAQLESLKTRHNQAVASINKEITRIQQELVYVRANIAAQTDPYVKSSLLSQEATLMQQETAQKKSLSNENSSYSTQKLNLENQINYANNDLTNIAKVDTKFMDNVETVNGYINVRWVSLWEMSKIFSPIPPTIVIIILVILAWLLFRKKKFVPKVVVE